MTAIHTHAATRGAPSAAQQRATLEHDRAALAAHLDAVRGRRDALSPASPEWRHLSAEIRKTEAELGDYDEGIAFLAAKAEAEQDAERHAARVALHRRVLAQAQSEASAIPRDIDHALSKITALVPAYLEWVQRAATAAGVDPHPFRLGETVPTVEHMRDVILARLVAGGILGMEFMPARFADAPATHEDLRRAGLLYPGQQMKQPVELAAEARVLRDVHGAFVRAILNADPESRHAERERIARQDEARRQREEVEAQQPRRMNPAPAPLTYRAVIPGLPTA